MIKWFSRHAVCTECGAHFTPVKSLYGDTLCSAHRAPAEEKQKRYESVVNWAAENWERLEEQMRQERKEAEEKAGMVPGQMERMVQIANELRASSDYVKSGGYRRPFDFNPFA